MYFYLLPKLVATAVLLIIVYSGFRIIIIETLDCWVLHFYDVLQFFADVFL